MFYGLDFSWQRPILRVVAFTSPLRNIARSTITRNEIVWKNGLSYNDSFSGRSCHRILDLDIGGGRLHTFRRTSQGPHNHHSVRSTRKHCSESTARQSLQAISKLLGKEKQKWNCNGIERETWSASRLHCGIELQVHLCLVSHRHHFSQCWVRACVRACVCVCVNSTNYQSITV